LSHQQVFNDRGLQLVIITPYVRLAIEYESKSAICVLYTACCASKLQKISGLTCAFDGKDVNWLYSSFPSSLLPREPIFYLCVLNNLDRCFSERAFTDLAWLSQSILSKAIYPEDRNPVRPFNPLAFQNGVDLCMNEDLMVLAYLLCEFCLIRMRFDIRVLSYREDVSSLVIDDCGYVIKHDVLYHAFSLSKTWCPHHDSNTGPTDYKSVALPAEL
jgi:hypothetical protein